LGEIELELPWPPSVNHYYGRHGNRTFIAKRGVEYREIVNSIFKRKYPDMEPIDSLVKLRCLFFSPDKRKRDLGNLDKCLLDALTKAGVWEDDYLVDDQRFRRARHEDGSLYVVKDGFVYVKIIF